MLNTQLLAFLDSKLSSETYPYSDSSCCAAAQFNASVGREYPVYHAVADRDAKSTFDGRLESLAYQRPHNFGALRERAKKEFA